MDIDALTDEYDMRGMTGEQIVKMGREYVRSLPDQQVRVLLHLAADEIERLRARPPAWVACSDRMPDNGQNVAFVVKSGSQFYGGLVFGGRYESVVGFTVPGAAFVASHWMPLPEPPAECGERGKEG